MLLADVGRAAERIVAVIRHLRTTGAATVTPPAPASDHFPHSEPDTQSRARVRILLVDDDDLVRTALRRMLREHDVVDVDGAESALARIRGGEWFDVVLCDLMMPGMTGVELFDEVTRLAPRQAERMVFLTGGALTERVREFVATVSNRVLEKPVEGERLREVIRSRAGTQAVAPVASRTT